jgi:hydroxyethylthiazole kinase
MRLPDGLARESAGANAAALNERLRAQAPRVHCITNAVAQNFTANMLLAAGAVPSMTLDAKEVGGFVARSGALLVNLGTLDRARREAIHAAVDAAAAHRVPWVLDPVFIDRSPPRAAFARELLARAPAVVRLNHAEFAALTDAAPTPDAAAAYARAAKTVVALSGETDLVTDGARLAAVANGHPLMAKVTAMGCAGSALLAGALAVENDAWRAATGALALIGVAGEIAAEHARGPGSFAAGILDALYGLDGPDLAARARVT